MTKEELDFIGSMNMCDEISNKAYQKIVNHFEKTQPSDDCVSRKFMYELGATCIATRDKNDKLIALGTIENLPPVTPTHGTCKDCSHWKDSDGVYRRGIDAESKCPVNNSRVFEGTFYCADFEKQGNLDGSN